MPKTNIRRANLAFNCSKKDMANAKLVKFSVCLSESKWLALIRCDIISVGNSGSVWSSDYSDYEEYEFGAEDSPTSLKSETGSDEKEIGSDLPPEIYCDLVSFRHTLIPRLHQPWPGGPGLVAMGEDSCSEGHGFESQHPIMNGHFFTYICCNNRNDCLKRRK